jgi:hypothetical protein
MPVKSKSQARFMRAVMSGSIKKEGLSKAVAKEFVEGVPTKRLPERRPSAQETRNKNKSGRNYRDTGKDEHGT